MNIRGFLKKSIAIISTPAVALYKSAVDYLQDTDMHPIRKYIYNPLKAIFYTKVMTQTFVVFAARTFFNGSKVMEYFLRKEPNPDPNTIDTDPIVVYFAITLAGGTLLSVMILRGKNIHDLFWGKSAPKQTFTYNRYDLLLMPELPTDLPLKNVSVITRNPFALFQFDAKGNSQQLINGTDFEDLRNSNQWRSELNSLAPNKCKSIKSHLNSDAFEELDNLISSHNGVSLRNSDKSGNCRKYTAIGISLVLKTINFVNWLPLTSIFCYLSMMTVLNRLRGPDDKNPIIAADFVFSFLIQYYAFNVKGGFMIADEAKQTIQKSDFDPKFTPSVLTFLLTTPAVFGAGFFGYYGTLTAIPTFPSFLKNYIFSTEDMIDGFCAFSAAIAFTVPLITQVPSVYNTLHKGKKMVIPQTESELLKTITCGSAQNPWIAKRNLIYFLSLFDLTGTALGNFPSIATTLKKKWQINPYDGYRVLVPAGIICVSAFICSFGFSTRGGFMRLLPKTHSDNTMTMSEVSPDTQLPDRYELLVNDDSSNNTPAVIVTETDEKSISYSIPLTLMGSRRSAARDIPRNDELLKPLLDEDTLALSFTPT